uniref:Baculoviral IAP repeat-containing protein 1e-like n=1 Tax=Lepisosteus oculatus TaxID=7918 RepID=W5MJV9_LEPOC|nr:PREDICTED: baculoviral IAP repeat-containing protein 1e-like [Lepisosteus oculatus]XP_015219368.1 PREDICTED: baculoviral IAP repeat-containing protein 1e-like [Lepisosteus oculatus]XP_015219369.1 PREDICTED: baculoviral IAP repeat-containing protein 1e-like [Lepisosteus oculatus]XP_015219370.1 PREDICTED: baculoviral IAP repeat-containing protein 1e-like [Lepisosteus oculatus]
MAAEIPNTTQDPQEEDYFSRKEVDFSEHVFSFLNHNSIKIQEDNEKMYQTVRKQKGRRYNHQMRSELERIKTMQESEAFGDPSGLAEAGFYSIEGDKAMQCFCCGVVIGQIGLQKRAMEKHREWDPNCGFVKGDDVGNIPKYDVRVQVSEAWSRNSGQKFNTKQQRVESFHNWPFYAQLDPSLLAEAGFFYTGTKDHVLCFCCGGCLGHWGADDDPWEEHAKWFPECEYLQTKKTTDEILDYINQYNAFKGVKGSHFKNRKKTPEERTCSTDLEEKLNIFADENLRLESFLMWPSDSSADPKALSQAGFFYTGTDDKVKCFLCGTEVFKWEDGDVPFEEHQKWSPQCPFVLDKQQHHAFEEMKSESTSKKNNLQDQEPEFPECNPITEDVRTFEDRLSNFLRNVYSSLSFCKPAVVEDVSCFAIDLKKVFVDLAMTSQEQKGSSAQSVTLPELLRSLDGLTVVKGGRGTGKTALLKKIAILWASDYCPVLSRFQFVFYVSFSNLNASPALVSVKANLERMMKQYGESALFLLDDVGEGENPLLEKLREKLQSQERPHCLSMVIAICPYMMDRINLLPDRTVTLKDFPTCRSACLVKRLIWPNLSIMKKCLEKLWFYSFKASLKTPFCALALCISLVQKPGMNLSTGSSFYSTFVQYLMQGIDENSKLLLVEQLAWEGLMRNQFEFTDKDLTNLGLQSGWLIKQGLVVEGNCGPHSLRFIDEYFQEYLAGRYLAHLFNSDQIEKASICLSQIMPFPKALGQFYLLLLHCFHHSGKAATVIIPQLLAQYSCLDAWMSADTDKGLHKQSSSPRSLIRILTQCVKMCAEFFDGSTTHWKSSMIDGNIFYLINVERVLKLIYESNCTSVGFPIIRQHLAGTTLHFDSPMYPILCVLYFLKDYPQCIPELQCTRVTFSDVLDCVETDPSQPHSWKFVQLPVEFVSAFQAAYQQKVTGEKLHLAANRVASFEKNDVLRLSVLFSVFKRIDIEVEDSPGFLSWIQCILDKFRESWVRCRIIGCSLAQEDRKCLLSATELKVLELVGTAASPVSEYILRHLDKFTALEELQVSVSPPSQVVEKIPLGFRNLVNLRSIKLYNIDLTEDTSSLAWFIRHFSCLTVFHLRCASCPGFEQLAKALSSCKGLQELKLGSFTLNETETQTLASLLSNLQSLRILSLWRLKVEADSAVETFANALETLSQLECLKVPALTQRSELIVEKLHLFSELQSLRMDCCLNDDSLNRLAQTARAGHLCRLQKLVLNDHQAVTDVGWKGFFQGLGGLEELRSFSLSQKSPAAAAVDPGADTVQALMQCVSRMPCLRLLLLLGWFSKKEDSEPVRGLKQSHPNLDIDLRFKDLQLPAEIRMVLLEVINGIRQCHFT